MIRTGRLILAAHFAVLLTAAGCEPSGSVNAGDQAGGADVATAAPDGRPACDPDNGGLTLPTGFCALVVHEGVGPARHLVVEDDGDIYVALREAAGQSSNGIVA